MAPNVNLDKCELQNHFLSSHRLPLAYITIMTVKKKVEQIPPFKRKVHSDEVSLYKNPISKEYVSPLAFFTCAIIAPSVLILCTFLYHRTRKDTCKAIYAFTLTILLTNFLVSLLKISVGRPRPDFLQRCFPDGVIGDFDNCTGDKLVVNEGRKSFPSGHSGSTFAGLSFMTFYLTSKLNIFNKRGRGSSWRLLLSIAPLIIALEVAVSRTCDYHHHWQDSLAGSLIGLSISYLCFRVYFPSIFGRDCGERRYEEDKGMKEAIILKIK